MTDNLWFQSCFKTFFFEQQIALSFCRKTVCTDVKFLDGSDIPHCESKKLTNCTLFVSSTTLINCCDYEVSIHKCGIEKLCCCTTLLMHSVHRAHETVALPCQETRDFIPSDLWRPNIPDQNPVVYKIWVIMQHRVYQTKICSVGDRHLVWP